MVDKCVFYEVPNCSATVINSLKLIAEFVFMAEARGSAAALSLSLMIIQRP